MGRVRTNMPEDGKRWVQEFMEWKTSGQRQRRYCESRGLEFWRFKAGTLKARAGGELPSTGRAPRRVVQEKPGFAMVKIEEIRAETAPFCEILFEGKPGIRIETAESLRMIRDLVRAMCA